VSRAAAALALVYLATLGGDSPRTSTRATSCSAWRSFWGDARSGSPRVGTPRGPLRYTGPVAIALNCVVIVLLLVNPYTGGGAELFYGTSLVVAAWRRQPDCEATVLSNSLLRRDDQVGCPVFTPDRPGRGTPVGKQKSRGRQRCAGKRTLTA
jgi:hypothetical protein